jgi:hypothetical protein
MKKIVLLIALTSLLSGCATRHTEYVGYSEPYVVIGTPGYYWLESRHSLLYPFPRARHHWYGAGNMWHRPAPHGGSHRSLVRRPIQKPGVRSYRRAPTALRPSKSAIPRASSARRMGGGARFGGRGRMR